MRVMMLTPLYVPWVGGLEILVQQLCREFTGRGHELMVVTSHGTEVEPGAASVDGIPVLRVSAHDAIRDRDPEKIFAIQHELARASRSFAPEVVHSHDPGPLLWLYLRAARRQPRPVIVTLHNVMTHHLEGSMDVLAAMLRRADRVTGVSQDVVDDTLGYAPDVSDRISVVRNGVVPTVDEPTPPPVDPPLLACIGRLVPQKGFDRAIDAVAGLAPRHPTLRLLIAGDGPERAALEQRARSRGIADRVEFLGVVDREGIVQLLTQSTAVLMPSRFEGLPLVALEAAWCGRPVIATRAPGLDQAVVEDVTALVVDPNVDALAGAIDILLADPALARRLGTGARAHAEREFSLASCADAYEALYHTVTNASAAAAH